jgi:hypothetical protein
MASAGHLPTVTAAVAVRSALLSTAPPGHRPRIEARECVDASVERLVANARRLEPISNGMAADKARAHVSRLLLKLSSKMAAYSIPTE